MSNDSEMTLAEHAEAWWRETGRQVPEPDTQAWEDMYEAWVDLVFPEKGDW